MQLIHLHWLPQKDFFNTGDLYLWIEQFDTSYNKQHFPYSINQPQLMSLLDELAPNNFEITTLDMSFPINSNKQFIPSMIIANLLELEDVHIDRYQKTKVIAAKIADAPLLLKNLYFAQHYFDNDLLLADDAKFWIAALKVLSYMLSHNHYIPVIVPHRDKKHIEYFVKFSPFSEAYQQQLSILANFMPGSAANLLQDKTANNVIHHFIEYQLNYIIASTKHINKTEQLFKNTFIENTLSLAHHQQPVPTGNQNIYEKWLAWYYNLQHDQFGTSFTLCFQLVDPVKKNNTWQVLILIQSKTDPSYRIPLQQYWQDQNNSLYQKMFGKGIVRNCLLQLGCASRIMPLLMAIFKQPLQNIDIQLNTAQAYQFLKHDMWTLKAAGFTILVPNWWSASGKLKAKIKLSASTANSKNIVSYLSKQQLIQFDYRYALGKHPLTEQEWLELIAAKSPLVNFQGAWVEINVEQMQAMQSIIENSQQNHHSGNITDLLTIMANDDLYEIDLDNQLINTIEQLQQKQSLKLIRQPASLKATLRDYQKRGLSWLVFCESIGINPCLADDMGLGKTIQVIALLLARPCSTAALLIAPTSLLANWQQELSKFAPTLKQYLYHGYDRKQQTINENIIHEYDLIISSYGTIRRDIKLLQPLSFSRVIIDEAQNIKNPNAAQTKSILKLQTASKIALTGTPVENRLQDLWSIFNFLNPGYLGKKNEFTKTFEYPIQRDNELSKALLLQRMTQPFILRRVKTDKNIVKELPNQIEDLIYLSLTSEQASLYQAVVDEIAASLTQQSDDKMEKQIMLTCLLQLKQICNHPLQYLQDNSAFTMDRSMKLQRLSEMATECLDNGESILIFSQYRKICLQLDRHFKNNFTCPIFCLHGQLTTKKRDQLVKQFQDNATPPAIFILTLKAGGVGLTLTKANHVFHYDRWWNPAVENQATDRAHRIGQQKQVFAHKFITKGTIEEKIAEILEKKQQLSKAIIGQDDAWLKDLSTTDFLNLIKLSTHYDTTA